MANELGTWGVVTDPYVPDLKGPLFELPRCGCVTAGSGPPAPSFGSNNDIYVNILTEQIYQKQSDVWVIIGSAGGSIQVFSGHYSGLMPVAPIPDASVTAAFNYDLDAPFQTWKWNAVGLNWGG